MKVNSVNCMNYSFGGNKVTETRRTMRKLASSLFVSEKKRVAREIGQLYGTDGRYSSFKIKGNHYVLNFVEPPLKLAGEIPTDGKPLTPQLILESLKELRSKLKFFRK